MTNVGQAFRMAGFPDYRITNGHPGIRGHSSWQPSLRGKVGARVPTRKGVLYVSTSHNVKWILITWDMYSSISSSVSQAHFGMISRNGTFYQFLL